MSCTVEFWDCASPAESTQTPATCFCPSQRHPPLACLRNAGFWKKSHFYPGKKEF